MRSSPGVEAASFSTNIPLEGGSNGFITVPGQDAARLSNQLFEWNFVTPDHFRAFGIRLLAGRPFTRADEDETADVNQKLNDAFAGPNPPANPWGTFAWPGIVNRTMARMVWGEQDPIGRTFILGRAVTVRVIGVVGDALVRTVRDGALPQAFFAFPGALDGPI